MLVLVLVLRVCVYEVRYGAFVYKLLFINISVNCVCIENGQKQILGIFVVLDVCFEKCK